VALLVAAALPLGAAIRIDYPKPGTLFPPDFAPPTLLWHDSSGAQSWRVRVTFEDGTAPISLLVQPPLYRPGPIDPRAVAETNRPPEAPAALAGDRAWRPPAPVWRTIQAHSVKAPAHITLTGLVSGRVTGSGSFELRTSADPVGAPIFYRDVPLMPTETEPGVIRPLAPQAVRLIEWRLRDLAQPKSRVVMRSLPLCANCHSFSNDGKTLGMDLDGLRNNKGQYTITPLAPATRIGPDNVWQWRTERGRLRGSIRVGFMTQISPDGKTVVTTLNPVEGARGGEPPSNYYVQNFKDYHFLQVFFPTRGVLAWLDREAGILRPLPGADDPQFVHFGAVWSPDASYLVFARAAAREPNPPGAPVAQAADDPNERQIQYDLYRIPFNGGRGGQAMPLAGASANGMSNSFPKVSPDGKWIVFVKARNGQLMRPDSELWIIPAAGGEARRMRCNQAPMNSWHSFSPNGKWMVYSSKARGPYTQMYLTHLDEEGQDTPPVLIEDSTASNRAVNLPEFVNIKPEELLSIEGPALDFSREYDQALYYQKARRYQEALPHWRAAVAAMPNDPMAHDGLALALRMTGQTAESGREAARATELRLREAVELDAGSAGPYLALAEWLSRQERMEEARTVLREALEVEPASAQAARALAALEKIPALMAAARQESSRERALALLNEALQLEPQHAPALAARAELHEKRGLWQEALADWRSALERAPRHPGWTRRLAWLLATCPEAGRRDAAEALRLALSVRATPASWEDDDLLAAAYAAAGRREEAREAARRALAAAPAEQKPAVEQRLREYSSQR